jgi:hypothetical protein
MAKQLARTAATVVMTTAMAWNLPASAQTAAQPADDGQHARRDDDTQTRRRTRQRARIGAPGGTGQLRTEQPARASLVP